MGTSPGTLLGSGKRPKKTRPEFMDPKPFGKTVLVVHVNLRFLWPVRSGSEKRIGVTGFHFSWLNLLVVSIETIATVGSSEGGSLGC